MNEIVLLKLITGEELVAKKIDEVNETWVLSNPRVLTVTPADNGQMGIGMIPWLVGDADGDVTIKTSSIIGQSTEIPKQLENGYIQNTTSIQLGGM